MKVRNQMVKQKQKQHADPKADKGREKGQLAHILRLLNGRNQQAPDRSCNHYSGSKAGKRPLYQITQRFFHKEYAGRTQRCTEKGNQYS